jgi:ribosomal protein L40E
MFISEMKEPVGLKQCHRCRAELLRRDRYCRRCGISQSVTTAPLMLTGRLKRSDYATRPFPGDSGALINFVGSVTERT